MASKIKKDGKTGAMLQHLAGRGGSILCDYPGFPPSGIMLPLRRRGLVTLQRDGLPRTRRNIWRLTAKGWDASGAERPVIA